jgi:hypothetical protein
LGVRGRSESRDHDGGNHQGTGYVAHLMTSFAARLFLPEVYRRQHLPIRRIDRCHERGDDIFVHRQAVTLDKKILGLTSQLPNYRIVSILTPRLLPFLLPS